MIAREDWQEVLCFLNLLLATTLMAQIFNGIFISEKFFQGCFQSLSTSHLNYCSLSGERFKQPSYRYLHSNPFPQTDNVSYS